MLCFRHTKQTSKNVADTTCGRQSNILIKLIVSCNVSYSIAARPRPSAEKIALKKSLSPSNLSIQKFDCYQSYDEFCKHVASLKLPQNWEIIIGNNVHCWKKDDLHEIPEMEVY